MARLLSILGGWAEFACLAARSMAQREAVRDGWNEQCLRDALVAVSLVERLF